MGSILEPRSQLKSRDLTHESDAYPGMKWTEEGASVVLSLRALSYTPERWGQFWEKVDRWGFPVAA